VEAGKGTAVCTVGMVSGACSAEALVADVYAAVGVVSHAIGAADMGWPLETSWR
jgi:hypothetical protein